MNQLSLSLLIILISTSCSMKKNLDEMQANTKEMHDYTKEMNENTKDLNNIGGESNETLQHIEGPGIQKEAKVLRNEEFQSMIKAESMMEKIEHATAFYYGFEEQVWDLKKSNPEKSLKLRTTLQGIAVSEWIKRLAAFLPESKKKYSFDVTSNKNDMKNLCVLASVMHRTNPYQAYASEGTYGIKIESFFDYVTRTLRDREVLSKDRSELTRLEYEVYQEEDVILYMMQLRAKCIPMIALGRISPIYDGIFNGLFTKLHMLTGPWTIQLGNRVQVDYANEFFLQLEKTQNFLNDMGITPEADKKIGKIYNNLRWPEQVPSEMNYSVDRLKTHMEQTGYGSEK